MMACLIYAHSIPNSSQHTYISMLTGGPSIIPTQALNIDCTCFFEMYHVSRQSFLYLKSFYIGELNPADLVQLKRNEIQASEGFLHSLRSYTDQWRIQVEETLDGKVHKSL